MISLHKGSKVGTKLDVLFLCSKENIYMTIAPVNNEKAQEKKKIHL